MSRRPLPAAVLAVLAAASAAVALTTIPAPESVLGHRVGDDFFLATYDESIAYFRNLAAASDRVELAGTASLTPIAVARIWRSNDL